MAYRTLRATRLISHDGVLRFPDVLRGANARDFVVNDKQAAALLAVGGVIDIGAAITPTLADGARSLRGRYRDGDLVGVSDDAGSALYLPQALRRSQIVTKNEIGATPGTFPLTDKTTFQTTYAPGPYFAARCGIRMEANYNAQPTKASLILGATRWGNGWTLQNTAGANIAPTPVTFGPADLFDFQAAAGGQANTVFVGATGSQTGTKDLKESISWMDWVAADLDQDVSADDPTLPLPVSCRAHSVGTVGGSTGNYELAGPPGSGGIMLSQGIRRFKIGYWYGDQTAVAAPGGGDPSGPYGLNCVWQFHLKRPGMSWLLGCDSTFRGYTGSASQAAGGSPGSAIGFLRIIADELIDAGIPVGYYLLGHETHHSRLFHYRIMRALEEGKPLAAHTHVFCQLWSVNDFSAPTGAPPYGAKDAILRVAQIQARCALLGIKFVLIVPVAARDPRVSGVLMPFVDNMEANGVSVLRMDDVLTTDGVTLKPEYNLDEVHPNWNGIQACARYTKSRADELEIA